MRKYLRQKVRAYFTVEAAMVIALVMSVIVTLVYIMLFQYNRCLLEQDIGTLALKGCTIQTEGKNQLIQELKKYESQIYWDKYIAWEHDEATIELKQDRIIVEQSGSLIVPFAEEGSFSQESVWGIKAGYENRYISPVSFIRRYNKLTGGN